MAGKKITPYQDGKPLYSTTDDFSTEVLAFVKEKEREGVRITIQEAVFDMKTQITLSLEKKFAKAKKVMEIVKSRLSNIKSIKNDDQQEEARKIITTFKDHEKAITAELDDQKSAMHALHKHVCGFENSLLNDCRQEYKRVRVLTGAYEQEVRRKDQERVLKELAAAREEEEKIKAKLEEQKTPENEVAIEEMKAKVHIPVEPPRKNKGFIKTWELTITDEKALKTHLLMEAPHLLEINIGGLKSYLQSEKIAGDWNGAKMREVLI